MEDHFSTDRQAVGWGDVSGSNVSDGEQEMKLYSLPCHSPPAVQPDSYQAAAWGLGTPVIWREGRGVSRGRARRVA